MTPDKPSWWQMFEPIVPPEVRSLIGEIEPVKETARERADRIWKMDDLVKTDVKEPTNVH
jgi:hypothetical protein